jgi:hypothetical protein
VKLVDDSLVGAGEIAATRAALDRWMATVRRPWTVAMEATPFPSWVYEHLKPHAAGMKVANPSMRKAIAASKRKNDHIDAGKIADLPRADPQGRCPGGWLRA